MGTPDALKGARPVWEGLCRNLPLEEGQALCFHFIPRKASNRLLVRLSGDGAKPGQLCVIGYRDLVPSYREIRRLTSIWKLRPAWQRARICAKRRVIPPTDVT
jgi:hypothetical protein